MSNDYDDRAGNREDEGGGPTPRLATAAVDVVKRSLELGKRGVMLMLNPPWEKDGPDNFTLAVPEAHSTFKQGAVGWANRPPVTVECPECARTFDHTYANDFVDCPHCHFEHSPEDFEGIDIVQFTCPNCGIEMDHGVRHPHLVDTPEWASCSQCQFHWEYLHDYTSG